MEIRLNPDHDLAELAATFAAKRRVQVRDLFEPESAEAIHRCLAEEVEWVFVYNKPGTNEAVQMPAREFNALPEAERRALMHGIHDNARERFQYAYKSYPVLDAYLAGRDPHLLLHRLLEFINTPVMLDFIRDITGMPQIIKGDAQATLYESGEFLTHHSDVVPAEHRNVAFVMNMTKGWRPDWGGYVVFFDEHFNIAEGFKPEFNTLNMFEVGVEHSVQYVTPFAAEPRLAVTGWFRHQ